MWAIAILVLVCLIVGMAEYIRSVDKAPDPFSVATRIRMALAMRKQDIDQSRKRKRLIESLFEHIQYIEHDEDTLEHKAMTRALNAVESWEAYTDCIVLSPFVFYCERNCFQSNIDESFRCGILLKDVHKHLAGNRKICQAFTGDGTSTSIQIDPDVSDRLIVEFLESFFEYYHQQLHELQKAQTKRAAKRMARVKDMMPSLGQCPGCKHTLEVDNSRDFLTCDYCQKDLVEIDGDLELLTPRDLTETNVVLDNDPSPSRTNKDQENSRLSEKVPIC